MEIVPIITAIVSGGAAAIASIIVAVIRSRAQQDGFLAELDKRDALQAQRLDELEKKMDKHNQHIERTYKLEQQVAVIESDLRSINHRLDDLERK